ncbi:hypothetical protein [Agromyces sp. GXQ0307]|uniref:hypothetical protein n=1 Tax=Agromyces sp. GXQ0307 TaxID=3377835 RepID=UPI00383B73D7
MSDSDGIEEAFEGALRTSLAVAGRLGEQLARMREEALRRAEARSLQEARELQGRFDAERAAARAELAPVHEASWWDRAGTENIARAYETATTWSKHDDDARRANERIREEVRARYGVDVDRTGADPAAVREALARVDADRNLADAERSRADEERAEAARLLEHADRVDAAADRDQDATATPVDAREGAEVEWDSAERRDAHAATLDGKANAEAINAWRQADSDNAKHPREAVRRAGGKSPKARKSRPGGDREMQRGRGR